MAVGSNGCLAGRRKDRSHLTSWANIIPTTTDLSEAKHTEIFEKFSATFPPEMVMRWVQMVEHWESNPKAPNPYNKPEQSKSKLAWDENLQLASGHVQRHKVTLMGFFSMAFDIEDWQSVLM